jgi:hypothetical protein
MQIVPMEIFTAASLVPIINRNKSSKAQKDMKANLKET